MKSAFKEWHHWLQGAKHPFLILTDHQILQYLRIAKRLNPRQAKWVLFFTCFNFTFTYCPGSKNVKADALYHQHEYSQKFHTKEPIILPMMVIAPVQWDIKTEITYVPLTFCKRVIQWVHSSSAMAIAESLPVSSY